MQWLKTILTTGGTASDITGAVSRQGDTEEFAPNNIRKYWEQVSGRYDKAVPPGRPSEQDIALYDSYIKGVAQKNTAVILGCTPDLRTLAAKYFNRILVADFSDAMLRESAQLVGDSVLSKEQHFNMSWLDLHTICPPGSVDAVLGDSIFGQLEPDVMPGILSAISNALTSRGVFIGRVRLQSTLWRTKTLSDIMRQYIADGDIGDRSATMAFMYRLYDHLADETGRVYTHGHLLSLKIALRDFTESEQQRIVRTLYRFHPYPCVWSQLEEVPFERMVRKEFPVLEKKVAMDYPEADCFPVFLFSKGK